jgi:RNA polymerase sigma-70 factor, ECF subfamily
VASDTAAACKIEDEERRVAEAQLGDLGALRPILERYASPLYGSVILPRLGDPTSAEEILLETLATAVEKIGSFTWQGKSIYPWLRQIAINKIFDLHRHIKRSRRLVEALSFEIGDEGDDIQAADAQLMADQERRHHRQRIDDTLAEIQPRYRAAIELRLISELSREECATRLQVSVATFDVLLFRAVRSFRKVFGARELAQRVRAAQPTSAPTVHKEQ